MDNLIVVLILLVILGLAAGYVIRAKKQGQKCIGCPHAAQCARQHGAPCSCSGKSK